MVAELGRSKIDALYILVASPSGQCDTGRNEASMKVTSWHCGSVNSQAERVSLVTWVDARALIEKDWFGVLPSLSPCSVKSYKKEPKLIDV